MTPVGVTVVNTGAVTAGLFQGDTIVKTLVMPSTNYILCQLGLQTVSTAYGTNDLVITSL